MPSGVNSGGVQIGPHGVEATPPLGKDLRDVRSQTGRGRELPALKTPGGILVKHRLAEQGTLGAFFLADRDDCSDGVENPANPDLPSTRRPEAGWFSADWQAAVKQKTHRGSQSLPSGRLALLRAKEVVDGIQQINPGVFLEKPEDFFNADVVETWRWLQAKRQKVVLAEGAAARRKEA